MNSLKADKIVQNDTLGQYDEEMEKCRQVFINKTKDYGTAWRILRLPSLTDQLFIKGNRIRNIEEVGISKVDEGVESEYIGLVNYSLIALIQLNLDKATPLDLAFEQVLSLYNHYVDLTRQLMIRKNHDYGEAWRDMRRSSLTDLILMKLLRVKQIEDYKGKTLVSQGVEASYQDIINYSIFALIKLTEQKET